jgi:hypothetical protein
MHTLWIRSLGRFAAAALLITLAGCGKGSPTQPIANAQAQQDADDAAQQVALSMAQDNGGATAVDAPGALLQSGTGAAPLGSSPGVASSSDTTFTAGHITWSVSRSFFDAIGNEQTAFDPITTVRMLAAARGVGSIETASDTASFGSAGHLDVRGLATAQDTVITNAARNDTLQCAFTPRFRPGRVHSYVEGSGTLTDVAQLRPVSSNPWPLSGTATWALKVDRLRTSDRGTVTRHFETLVIVTFNGTRFPDVEVTGGFRYKIDLKTGAIQRA